MDLLKAFVLLTLLCAVVFWLRVRPFREKKTREPERSARAQLTARRVESGTGGSGRSAGMGYSYRLVFRTEDGREPELYATETEYGSLREGAEGTLTWKGPYFIAFEQEVC